MNIAEHFQKEHDKKIVESLGNANSRLGETMGGMNPTDQSYDHFNYASHLILTAKKTIEEGLELIEIRKKQTLTQESQS